MTRARPLLAAAAAACALAALAAAWLWPRYPMAAAAAPAFSAERLSERPIIHAGLALPEWAADGAHNINGPALIRVPDWIANPLGQYYLYFAHHKGGHIRVAYADSLGGPWRLRPGGALSLAESGFAQRAPDAPSAFGALAALWRRFSVHVVRDHLLLHRAVVADRAARRRLGLAPSEPLKPHVASPELVVDHDARRLLMFYHGLMPDRSQMSRVAVSTDGLRFAVTDALVPSPYLRAFAHRGRHYLLGMPGVLYRSERVGGPYAPRARSLFGPDARHSGVLVDGDALHVFWSRVGDAPECILSSTVDLGPTDWDDWRASEPRVALCPERRWEGAGLEARPSLRGELAELARELRDPFAFVDSDGARYLLYAGGGEQAIGIARLRPRR